MNWKTITSNEIVNMRRSALNIVWEKVMKHGSKKNIPNQWSNICSFGGLGMCQSPKKAINPSKMSISDINRNRLIDTLFRLIDTLFRLILPEFCLGGPKLLSFPAFLIDNLIDDIINYCWLTENLYWLIKLFTNEGVLYLYILTLNVVKYRFWAF